MTSTLTNIPKPILPKDSLSHVFLDFDATELARQLTLIDHGLFCKIKPRELIGINWLKEEKQRGSSNLLHYINWQNSMISWLTTEIVTQSNQKLRVQTMERIIDVVQVTIYIYVMKVFGQAQQLFGDEDCDIRDAITCRFKAEKISRGSLNSLL